MHVYTNCIHTLKSDTVCPSLQGTIEGGEWRDPMFLVSNHVYIYIYMYVYDIIYIYIYIYIFVGDAVFSVMLGIVHIKICVVQMSVKSRVVGCKSILLLCIVVHTHMYTQTHIHTIKCIAGMENALFTLVSKSSSWM